MRQNNKDLIIKAADKGSSIVIMNIDYSRDKLVLADNLNGNEYMKVNIDSDKKVTGKLAEFIKK